MSRPVQEALARLAPLPWATDLAVEPGVIFDGRGNQVLAVDVFGDRPDVEAAEIARLLVLAMSSLVLAEDAEHRQASFATGVAALRDMQASGEVSVNTAPGGASALPKAKRA